MKKLTCLVTFLGLVVMWEPNFAQAFSAGELSAILSACQTTASATPSALRPGAHTKIWCAVADREGELQLIKATDTGEAPAASLTSDAWRGSIENRDRQGVHRGGLQQQRTGAGQPDDRAPRSDGWPRQERTT
jgi:hypothetical protein